MTTESPASDEQERNVLEIGLPERLREEDLFINNPGHLERARELHQFIWQKNSRGLTKSLMFADIGEIAGTNEVETPQALDAGSLGQYQRTEQEFYTAKYKDLDNPLAPTLQLDIGKQVGPMKDTEEEERLHRTRECQLEIIHSQSIENLLLSRKVQFVDNLLVTDSRETTMSLTSQHNAIMKHYGVDRAGEGEVVISATKWFHEDEKYQTSEYNWMREDRWNVRIGVQGKKGSESVASLHINKDKREITVMPQSHRTDTRRKYYPSAELIEQILPQIPIIVPLQGEYSILKGRYKNQPPPNQEIDYPKVNFK